MKGFSIKSFSAGGVFFLFIIISIWWLLLNSTLFGEQTTHSRYVWGAAYQVLALWGGISGLLVSHSWGGFKSVLGRSVAMFSLGLLLQVFGQSVYSYYNLYAQIEAPYPSLGDVGFFGSIPCYVSGIILLAHAAGARVSFKSFLSQIQAVVLPLILLFLSYFVFLKSYVPDWSSPLTIFLDFGYPLGQAFYFSVAILTLILTRKVLGGMMRGPVLFITFALLAQYIADFNFLYQAHHETWVVSGYGDYLYALSYFLMSVGLIYVGQTFDKLKTP